MGAGDSIDEAASDGSVSGSVLLDVSDLRVWFSAPSGTKHKAPLRAVDGLTFKIHSGETLGLVGETGCGKSTTGRAVLQLVRPTSGSVVFDGIDLTRLDDRKLRPLRRHMQLIFQDPYSSLNPRMSVGDIIAEAIDIHRLRRGTDVRRRVEELLVLVGLVPNSVHRFPHEFSGGQRQRIAIARALAVEPKFIVCDEPVSALDVSIQAQIINLLADLQDELQLTYLFISHDLAVVRHISDRIAVMYLGAFVELSGASELYRTPLHPYTVALLSAVPIPDPDIEGRRRRIAIDGDIPSPADPPSGCRFHTRCWLRERLGKPERCVTEVPALQSFEGTHEVACHFAAEVRGSAEQRQVAGVAPLGFQTERVLEEQNIPADAGLSGLT